MTLLSAIPSLTLPETDPGAFLVAAPPPPQPGIAERRFQQYNADFMKSFKGPEYKPQDPADIAKRAIQAFIDAGGLAPMLLQRYPTPPATREALPPPQTEPAK